MARSTLVTLLGTTFSASECKLRRANVSNFNVVVAVTNTANIALTNAWFTNDGVCWKNR